MSMKFGTQSGVENFPAALVSLSQPNDPDSVAVSLPFPFCGVPRRSVGTHKGGCVPGKSGTTKVGQVGEGGPVAVTGVPSLLQTYKHRHTHHLQ